MSETTGAKATRTTVDRRHLTEIVLDSTGEGIVVADETGKFLIWNRAATELVGIGAADIAPEHWSDYYQLFLPDETTRLPSEQLPLVRAMRGEVVDDYDLVVLNRRTGRRVWLSCYARPLRDASGGIRGGVVVFRDVTERRRMLRELESFARTVSHDLKAPLTGVRGTAEALRAECGDVLGETGRGHVDDILEAVGRMDHLIDDLLRHAHVGRGWEDSTPVSLAPVVERAIENLAGDIKKTGAVVDVRGSFPVVPGHAAGLEQLFQNLIGNALKFTAPNRRPEVEVGCDDEEQSCVVWVRDRGIGIDPRYHQSIFEVFRRLHGREEFGGTGIGLAIVKKVCDLHHGQVWVESSPGKGSTFRVRLPKKPPPA